MIDASAFRVRVTDKASMWHFDGAGLCISYFSIARDIKVVVTDGIGRENFILFVDCQLRCQLLDRFQPSRVPRFE